MADPRFFSPPKVRSLGEIVDHLTASGAISVPPAADLTLQIRSVAALDDAGEGDISFYDHPAYRDQFQSTRASACLVAAKYQDDGPPGCVMLATPAPYRAFAKIARLMFAHTRPAEGAGDGASIHPSVQLGEGVSVGINACLSAGVQVGAGSVIETGAVIGENSVIGRDCRIGTLAALSHCLIGDRVIVHTGARIGQEGFGFALGTGGGGHEKIPQLGRVIIQDDAEIGANSCLDRGSIPDTVIGEGTKIDNLVQIGHNVVIGRHCIIAGHSAIAGSTVLEDFVLIGGHSCIAGHLRIGQEARISGGAAVMRDVPAGASHGGVPARELKTMLRETLVLEQLTKERRRGS